MGYTSENLDVFILQWDKNRIESTAYFELHPGGLPEPVSYWLPGSAFVRGAAFDFLVACFELANPNFDYFARERFDKEQVERLVQELVDLVEALAPGCSRDTVFSRYNSLFGREIWDKVDTELLRTAVAKNAAEVAGFVQTHKQRIRASGSWACDA